MTGPRKPKPHIKAAAIKTARGVVSKSPPARHKDVAKKAKATVGTSKGERGFVESPGNKFVGRQTAKRVAKRNGRANVRGRRGLHSEDLW